MTIEEGRKDMEREKEINRFMKKVLAFLKINKWCNVTRNIGDCYVTIEFRETLNKNQER